MAKQLTVKKDNALINAAYTLSLAEQRLILLSSAQADGDADELKDITIYAEQYAEAFKVSRQAAYMALKDAADSLFERRFSYERLTPRGNISTAKRRWVGGVDYVENEGRIVLQYHKDVIPLLCELKNKFTLYALEQVADLTSVHAVRLYELLIAWRSTGKTPVYELAEFRRKLGIEPDEYPRMTNFKQRVLDPAVAQINAHTDITAAYEQHKRGRSITGFSFSFTVKQIGRDPNTVDMLTGKTDAETAGKPKRQKISKSKAESMARVGETWEELYKRLSPKYIIV
ncbi:replication initiation protein RepM [Staphylococcus aureus]